MALTMIEIVRLLSTRGLEQYGGEAVSQLDHALQAAWLAERAGEPDTLVCAALLHDLGHLLSGPGGGGSLRGRDDAHQYAALPFLRGQFPEAVLAPIRLHVDAKRYLCAVEPSYQRSLSEESRRSLELQGGVFSGAEAAAFIAQPFAPLAVRMRRYDDLAKTPGRPTPPLAHFAGRLFFRDPHAAR